SEKHQLETPPRLLNRANQALQTLERYKTRLDEVSSSLGALEVEDLVTVRDVVGVLQRTELVIRISDEIDRAIVELGVDGRLVQLQLEELTRGVEDDRRLVIADYFQEDSSWHLDEAMSALSDLATEELLDLETVAGALHLPGDTAGLDSPLTPRGNRLVARLPRLSPILRTRIIEHFGSLPKLLRASAEDLLVVDGVADLQARAVADGLARLAESSILDRY
ncbi:MAG: DNA integrity scanning protein DisA, partial [Actinomycetia bacterium]|nr:DNA integrity scanning protein DisA [Actinomycetes bacterium]